MRTWMGLAVVAAGCVVAGGCHEPTDVVPVYPLGMEPSKIPNIASGEGAQALGEQPVVAPGQNRVMGGGAEGGLATSPPTPVGTPRTTPSGLTYVTTKEGTGDLAKTGQQVQMHYTGTLENGSTFDSSRGGEPFSVRIGTGQVIAGWDEGVPGMKVGEQRRLTIPAKLAYGEQAQKGIPANSTLIFDVELLKIDK